MSSGVGSSAKSRNSLTVWHHHRHMFKSLWVFFTVLAGLFSSTNVFSSSSSNPRALGGGEDSVSASTVVVLPLHTTLTSRPFQCCNRTLAVICAFHITISSNTVLWLLCTVISLPPACMCSSAEFHWTTAQ